MNLTDGLTLTCFSMMDVNTNISKHVEGFIPSVCTESPAPGIYGQFHCTAFETNLYKYMTTVLLLFLMITFT